MPRSYKSRLLYLVIISRIARTAVSALLLALKVNTDYLIVAIIL